MKKVQLRFRKQKEYISFNKGAFGKLEIFLKNNLSYGNLDLDNVARFKKDFVILLHTDDSCETCSPGSIHNYILYLGKPEKLKEARINEKEGGGQSIFKNDNINLYSYSFENKKGLLAVPSDECKPLIDIYDGKTRLLKNYKIIVKE